MATVSSKKLDTRVCANCRKLFEVKPRSYRRFCDDCLAYIFKEAGEKGGRPKKSTT